MTARKYNMLQIPLLSFFSKGLYADMALRWKGVGLIYLFLLLCICWAAIAYQMQTQFSKFLNQEEVAEMLDKIPDMSITNGVISVDVTQPYYVSDPDSGKTIFVIDTTGQLTELPDADAIILVTRSKIIARQSPHEVREYDLSGMQGEFKISQEKIRQWMGLIGKWSGVAIFAAALPLSFIYRVIVLLFLALVGLAMNSGFGGNIGFGGLMRIAVAAMTPSIIVRTVLRLIEFDFPFRGMLLLVVTILLVVYGVKAAIAEAGVAQQFPEPDAGTEV